MRPRPDWMSQARLAGALAALAVAPGALAWSSTDAPFFRPVHQMAIANVLGKTIAPAEVRALQDQQPKVDAKQYQDAKNSYRHSMTGIEQGHDYKVEKPIYMALTLKLLRDTLAEAIRQRKLGNVNAALAALGEAIHALQDATSPAHEGFQAWHDNEGPFAQLDHVMKENRYPKGNYQTRLEGALRWAYDIYLETIPLPASFFDAAGNLVIPRPYVP